MDTITGLPSHPLLVHLPVVAIPLAALLGVLFAVIPSWRSVLAYLMAGMGALVAVGVVLAASTGESLQEAVDENALVHTHAELGDQMEIIGVIFGLALIALGLYTILTSRAIISLGAQRSHTLLIALMGITLVAGAVATVWDVRTGHSGAKAVWTEDKNGQEAASLSIYIIDGV